MTLRQHSKIYLFTASLAMITLIGSSSCQQRNPQKSDIVFDTLVYNRTINIGGDKDNRKLNFSIDYIYPTNDVALLCTCNGTMFGVADQTLSIEELLKRFEQHVTSEYASLLVPDTLITVDSMTTTYFFERCNSVTLIDDYLMVGEMRQNDVVGAVQTSPQVVYYNINRESGELIHERDLFVNGYREPLSQLLINQLLADSRASSIDELNEQSLFNIDELMPNDNFKITPEGLTYCFNHYQVVGEQTGNLYITLDYVTLSPIVRLGSIVEHFYQN